ncbi:putative GEM-like protein 8 [Neltuma alba]|uniref:putative GEM-like protein 8 n=1 Tax=Neltuma alba TaxID=207710 RepID=UPI0010A47057|nr:putative GEM-like protein 8 [Prosopis alba]
MSSSNATPERFSSLSKPVNSLQSPTSSYDSFNFIQTNKEKEDIAQKNISGRKNSTFAYRICEHVKLGPKLSETLKGKLSLGSKIIQEGGRRNIFKRIFGMEDDEQLLKASQCYLYTTAGPIAGVLFISTEKIAFCSERPMNFSSSTGDLVSAPYKVLIPIEKIKEASESENVNKSEQKFIEIVTKDGSEFWFLGFLRYEKALTNLQKAISMAS